MKNDLNQEDITKLLRWKGNDKPSRDYLDEMQISIAKKIEEAGSSSKGENTFETFMRSLCDAEFFSSAARPTAALGSLAIVVLTIYFSFNKTEDDQMSGSSRPSSFAGSDAISLTNETPNGPNLNVMNVSSGGDSRVSLRTISQTKNLTNQNNDPHFPFGESGKRLPTPKWPKQ